MHAALLRRAPPRLSALLAPRRPLTHMPASPPEPVWAATVSSPGRDNARDLLTSGWSLSRTRDGLEREYVFRGFGKAMAFMADVAEECKLRKHHPEWANVATPRPSYAAAAADERQAFNTVRVRWTTHNPAGLSDKDVEMARFCDMKAKEVGLKEISASSWTGGGEGNLLEKLIPAGDESCDGACVGKK